MSGEFLDHHFMFNIPAGFVNSHNIIEPYEIKVPGYSEDVRKKWSVFVPGSEFDALKSYPKNLNIYLRRNAEDDRYFMVTAWRPPTFWVEGKDPDWNFNFRQHYYAAERHRMSMDKFLACFDMQVYVRLVETNDEIKGTVMIAEAVNLINIPEEQPEQLKKYIEGRKTNWLDYED